MKAAAEDRERALIEAFELEARYADDPRWKEYQSLADRTARPWILAGAILQLAGIATFAARMLLDDASFGLLRGWTLAESGLVLIATGILFSFIGGRRRARFVRLHPFQA